MPLMPLDRQLTDLGGTPVLWNSDTGTLVQDPTQGGTNTYGAGDVFRDAHTGDLYQLQPDGSLSLYRVATVPAVPPQAGTNPGISSAGPSWTDSPAQRGGPAITTTGNPTQWGHQAVTWLSNASFIGGLPNGLLLALGYVGYTFMRQRRRRNPGPRQQSRRFIVNGPDFVGEYDIYDQELGRVAADRFRTLAQARRYAAIYNRGQRPRKNRFGYFKTESNPGKTARRRRRREQQQLGQLYYGAWAGGTRMIRAGARGGDRRYAELAAKYQRSKRNPGGPRVVYNRLLGGWYVVVGPHQTPLNGRFGSKAEALAWLRRRNPGKRRRAERKEAGRHRRQHLESEQMRVGSSRYYHPFSSMRILAQRRRSIQGRSGGVRTAW